MEQMNESELSAPQENIEKIENLPQEEKPQSILEQLTEEELAELDRPEKDDYMRGRR